MSIKKKIKNINIKKIIIVHPSFYNNIYTIEALFKNRIAPVELFD